MRVVSWNLGYAFDFKTTHDRAWHYLGALDPDIAMLQEVRPELPAWVEERWTIVRRPPRYWGTLILVKPDLGPRELAGDHPRFNDSDVYLAAGTVTLPDGTSLLVGSVHAPIGEATGDELFGFDPRAIKTPYAPAPSRNDVAYRYYRDTVRGRRFLVSGDWNVSPRLWDEHHPGDHEAEFFDRARDDGWIDCYQAFHADEGQTLFKVGSPPYQADHAFCDGETAKALRDCYIYPHPAEDLKLSDHAPLILEFEP